MRKSHPFEPVWSKQSKILILGSLPSVVSVERGFYYMHPANRFWKILSIIYNVNLSEASKDMRKAFILQNNLALFDVIDSCEITNSSDQSIQNVKVQNLEEIINEASIERILLNGKKAYELFLKAYPKYESLAILLPSTSSANASWSLEALVDVWQKALE